jgi:hypothetical protein
MGARGKTMTHYDYKVVPAPVRARRIKGAHSPEEHFAVTLAEAINDAARQGWEYVRAETLHHETPGGWLRRPRASDQSVLIFRRERESAGPRLTAVQAEPSAPREPDAELRATNERAVVDRLQSTFARREPAIRREPRLGDEERAPRVEAEAPTPLRPAPRLGPAEKP